MARALYSLLVRLALPVLLLRLWLRGRSEPRYRDQLPERWGRYGTPATARSIWIHAVSMGETHAVAPLVSALRRRFPGHAILLTHTTATGRTASESLFGEAVMRSWLPWDTPGAVTRFLDHFRPTIGILMETEVWPNLVAAGRARGMALVLANARLSEKSARGYRRTPRLSAETFGAFSVVLAQTADDARRLHGLGAARLIVTGNIKFDVTPPPAQIEAGQALRRSIGVRPVLLAASTREGEEPLILDALAQLDPGALLMLVPRHPQRFAEVASMLAARALPFQRKSAAGGIAAGTRVLLGDSLGEMFSYLAACDVAFIGGSLVPLGGQNLIEAAAAGKPILIGPSSFNFAQATELALAAGAALRVETAAALFAVANRLISDPTRRQNMAAAASAFSAAHRGATERTLAALEEFLPTARRSG